MCNRHLKRAWLGTALIGAFWLYVLHALYVYSLRWSNERPAYLAAFHTQPLCEDAESVQRYNLGGRCELDRQWRQVSCFACKIMLDTLEEEAGHFYFDLLGSPYWSVLLFCVARNPDTALHVLGVVATLVGLPLFGGTKVVADEWTNGRFRATHERLLEQERCTERVLAKEQAPQPKLAMPPVMPMNPNFISDIWDSGVQSHHHATAYPPSRAGCAAE